MLRIIAALLAAVLSPTVSAEEPEWQKWPDAAQTPRAEATRVAVLDWCEFRAGEFGLLEDGQPYCVFVDENWEITDAFLGVWNIALGGEPLWWWEIRNNQGPDMQSGVLWLVDPYNHPRRSEEEKEADREFVREFVRKYGTENGEPKSPPPDKENKILMSFECTHMRMALNNPARVKVILVGPGIEQCKAWLKEHDAVLKRYE